eukprot:231968_1
MEQRNCKLNDLEILSVLFYCDEDTYCYYMRRSHRDSEVNSCEWKNFYYHLCCAIDKMYYVFHCKNKSWLKSTKYKRDLLSGMTITDLTQQQKKRLDLQTITSFSTSWSVAKDFAFKLKQKPTDKQGMILVIDNGIQELYEEKLKGADVSWISKHEKEDEYIVLPTVFRNFGYLKQNQRVKKGWIIPEYDHNVYVTANVKSTNVSFMTTDVGNQLHAPSSWLPTNIQHYKHTFEAVNHTAHVLGAIFGHLKTWCCPSCGVRSRLMEYTGNWLELTIECPSCRAYVFRSEFTINENERTFECFNHKCGKMIRRCDLRKIDESKSKLDPTDGYQCVRCKKQQRIAYLDRVAEHGPTLNRKANELLIAINKLVVMNYKHEVEINNPQYTNYSLKHFQLDIENHKDQLKEIIIFMHRRKNVTLSFSEIFKKFPILWKWLFQLKFIKRIFDAYKDGYTELLQNGYISESRGIINENTAEDVGVVIGSEMQKLYYKDWDNMTDTNTASTVMAGLNLAKGIGKGILDSLK